jgi:hypothetical protein
VRKLLIAVIILLILGVVPDGAELALLPPFSGGSGS